MLLLLGRAVVYPGKKDMDVQILDFGGTSDVFQDTGETDIKSESVILNILTSLLQAGLYTESGKSLRDAFFAGKTP